MLTAYATALRAREPSLERTGAGDWVRRATRRLSVLESAAAPTIADARTALARARVSIGSTMNLDERAEY